MLGSSLANKMTSTIPMMNHSFRMVVNKPMFQLRGFTGTPRPGRCLTTRSEVSELLGFSSGGTPVTKVKRSKRTHFRTREPQRAVKTESEAQRLSFFFFYINYRNTFKRNSHWQPHKTKMLKWISHLTFLLNKIKRLQKNIKLILKTNLCQ